MAIFLQSAPRFINALIEELLHDAIIPAVDKVAMVSVASRITVSKDKLPWLPDEKESVVDGLIEEGRDSDIETRRTFAIALQIGICHVLSVVVAVEINAIPARWELQLCSNTLVACIELGSIRHEVALHRTFRNPSVAHAVEAD